jgi:hypothetical protein
VEVGTCGDGTTGSDVGEMGSWVGGSEMGSCVGGSEVGAGIAVGVPEPQPLKAIARATPRSSSREIFLITHLLSTRSW